MALIAISMSMSIMPSMSYLEFSYMVLVSMIVMEISSWIGCRVCLVLLMATISSKMSKATTANQQHDGKIDSDPEAAHCLAVSTVLRGQQTIVHLSMIKIAHWRAGHDQEHDYLERQGF